MVKALVLDIETAPMVATTWGLYKQTISHENVLRDWYIVCACWKWLGQKRVHSAKIRASDAKAYLAGDGPPPDAAVVAALADAIREADFVIAHNGDRFDLKKLNARIIYHDQPPIPPVRTVDTLSQARKVAKFTSNRLDYLCSHLGYNGKIHTDYSLWLRVLHGEAKALNEMVAYCKQDVTELEDFYLRLRPYMDRHPNVVLAQQKAAPVDPENPMCPRCGSTNVHRRGIQKTLTQVYSRFHCQDCGSWSRASTIKGGILR